MKELDVNYVLFNEEKGTFAFPKLVGYFSLDGNRSFKSDLSGMRYLKYTHNNKIDFDLNKGFSTFVNKNPFVERGEKITHLLEFIVKNYDKLRQCESNKILRYDYVCFRGLLTKIMITPYQKEEDWTICAINFKGTIYLCAYDHEEKDYPNKDKFVYWGYKFEQYMFAKTPHETPNTTEPVNACEEFCVMFSSRVNNKLILYGGEIDGVSSNTTIDSKNFYNGVKFVEVKTNRTVLNKHHALTLRLKNLKWFCQSYLVGIENIYVGFRTNDGIIESISRCKVLEMPQQANGLWDKHTCLQFLNAFLNFASSVTKDCDDPYVVWKFHYGSKDGKVVVQKIENQAEYQFLPSWYIEEIKRHSESHAK